MNSDRTLVQGRGDGRPAPASEGYLWYVVLLLALVNAVNYMDRMALSVLLPHVKRDLELSDGQLGLLLGFAFSVFYAICGIPIARLADRSIRRNIIAVAIAFWSVMTALCGAAQNFLHLFIARIGVGAGEAGCLPPGQSILCDYVPVQRRPGFFAIHSFGIAAGMMLGMVLAGALGDAIGWRWTFVALGAPGLILAAIVFLTLREPPRGFYDVAETRQAVPLLSVLRALLGLRTYLWLTLAFILNGFVILGVTQWLPSFYARSHGLPMASIGVQLGFAIGLGQGGGTLIGGWLANRLAVRDVRRPLLMACGGVVLGAPILLYALFVRDSDVSLLLTTVALVSWSLSTAPMTSGLYSVAPSSFRATAGALNIFITSVLGFGLGPYAVGAVSDALSAQSGEESLRYALIMPAVLLPVVALVLFIASRTLTRDLQVLGVVPTVDSGAGAA